MKYKVAGCDLGKASAAFTVIEVSDAGKRSVVSKEVVAHEGAPLAVFADWYRREKIHTCAALAATGLYADELDEPVLAGLPEDACVNAATELLDCAGAFNLVSIGARGYSVTARDQNGRVVQMENDKCSSGTGETMIKIAGRFGLTIAQADKLALGAGESIPITARCSVFAKSEMTHFGNQGKPSDQLFRGFFESVARNVAALAARVRVPGPVYLIGGCAQIHSFVGAFSRTIEQEVIVPDGARLFEAHGAALLAAQEVASNGARKLPKNPDKLVSHKQVRIEQLNPAVEYDDQVTVMEAMVVSADRIGEPAILGLDLGSTGSKAVLTSVITGEPLADVYDRTRGNPVDAAQRMVRALIDLGPIDVRAVGATGSGREAVADVMRAAFPEDEERITVLNEIVAHATAAISCDPQGGKDLSIIEIGGQDAKFIQVSDGQIVESDMNKACSAGTGSFLEEQAIFYGMDDISKFGELADQSGRPPDLGQMCTVFVAEAAAEALNQGYETHDIFAGFQYSVIHNYINRVMGQRTLGSTVFFQGKPASNPSLARTLAAVTERKVVVPPNPGAMGAWGIGLCARQESPAGALENAETLELARFLDATVTKRSEFLCRDKSCKTYCPIERTQVAVGGVTRTINSGGACPKYEISTTLKPKLEKNAPNAFREREELMESYAGEREGAVTVGIPMVAEMQRYLPYFTTFFKETGIGYRVIRSRSSSLGDGEQHCFSSDACGPTKIAHGLFDFEADYHFIPKILDTHENPFAASRTCAIEQALPEMVEQSLQSRGIDTQLLRPRFHFGDGIDGTGPLGGLRALAKSLGIAPAKVGPAAEKAADALRRYEDQLAAIGECTIKYAADNELPVVVVCGHLHVIHERCLNAGIPDQIRRCGALSLPMDCFPLTEEEQELEKIYWSDSNRSVTVAVAARERGGVYPLLLSSFGCGPASFTEHIFHAMMDGYPHTMLESDGHGGAAGYVTRIQAFMHTVNQYLLEASPVPPERFELLEPISDDALSEYDGKRLVVFAITDGVPALIAATYRSFGYDAHAAGPIDADGYALAKRDCSGKECLPYQMIWGAFRKFLRDNPSDKHTVLLQVQGCSPCRNGMFTVKDRITLRRMGIDDNVSVSHFTSSTHPAFMGRLWNGLVAWDLLKQLQAYHGAVPGAREHAEELYHSYREELVALTATPVGKGRRAADYLRYGRSGMALFNLIERASRDYQRLEKRYANGNASSLRTVLLSGDVYVRLDDFSSDGLLGRLHERGLRVKVEPLSVLAEYLAAIGSSDLMGLPTDPVTNFGFKAMMARSRRLLYAKVRRRHPWLPEQEVGPMLEHGKSMLDHHPEGEAPITIGSVLHNWAGGACDGIVVAGPWGCGPAIISETLLRHKRDIPMLFVYSDGSPIDEGKINSFAFRLKQETPAAARV